MPATVRRRQGKEYVYGNRNGVATKHEGPPSGWLDHSATLRLRPVWEPRGNARPTFNLASDALLVNPHENRD